MKTNLTLGKYHSYKELGTEKIYGCTKLKLLEFAIKGDLPVFIYIDNAWVEVPDYASTEPLSFNEHLFNDLPLFCSSEKSKTTPSDLTDGNPAINTSSLPHIEEFEPHRISNEFVRISPVTISKLENSPEQSTDLVYLLWEKSDKVQDYSRDGNSIDVLLEKYHSKIYIDDLIFKDRDIKTYLYFQSFRKKHGKVSKKELRERALNKFLIILEREAGKRNCLIDRDNLNISMEDMFSTLKLFFGELFSKITLSSFIDFWGHHDLASCTPGPKNTFDLAYIYPIKNNELQITAENTRDLIPRTPLFNNH